MPFLGLGVHVLVALYFAVHAIRTGRQMYWLFILFAFPLLGSIVYFFAEFLPSTRIERHVANAGAQIVRSLDPGRELRDANKAFEISPTAQNQMRMAHALLEADRPDEAVVHYSVCLAGPFGGEPDVRLGAARAELARRNIPAAIVLLRQIREDTPKYRTEDIAVLLGQSYWAQGDTNTANALFAEASAGASSVEAKAEHIMFALSMGDAETARRLQREIDINRKTWNSHNRKLHKPLIARLDASWTKSGVSR